MKNILTKIKAIRGFKWWLLTAIIFVILVILVLVGNAILNDKYENKFLRGTKISGVDVSNLNVEEAKAKIEKRIDFINRRGFVYVTETKTVVVYPTVTAIESTDSSYTLIDWDIDQGLQQIALEQSNNSLNNFFNKLLVLIAGKEFTLPYLWHEQQHLEILQNNFADILSTKQEASFKLINNDLEIVPEQIGRTFDYEQAMEHTLVHIENLLNEDIDLTIKEDKPVITTTTINSLRNDILNTTYRGWIYLTFETKDWGVETDIWKQWLEVKIGLDGKPYVGFNQTAFDQYLVESGIKETIETPIQDAKFNLTNGKVTEFISSQEGRSINLEETVLKLEQVIQNPGELEVALEVQTVQPKVYNEEVNNLGIVELLGTGESDFQYSPVNRVHNIGVGATTLNGVLIAPGEEFSLITALGEIDGEHGYKQELVIKGNQTIPEYGGGLCQIGTTVFRGAIASGLPITMRRNHSYRVSYYEPAGTDATIYNPWPDLKFINDTGHHILIQTRIEGTKLYFDYWGTSDGRIVMLTEPVIYNIVAPPEKKIIKTIDLTPGQEKCTERAHNGADAKFDYTVQYPNQAEPVETIFTSHYIPWQEVCLIGVTEAEWLAEQTTASSTIEEL